MQYFLAKTEPSTYSIDQLAADVTTVWDGVRNPQALRAIRSMNPRDVVLIYHSGGESAITGIAEVDSAPRPDPADEKSYLVEVRFRAKVEPPVPLKEIKEAGLFADWALVRQPRLSTMSVPDAFIDWLRERRPDLLW